MGEIPRQEENLQEESYADKMIRQMREETQKDLAGLEKHKQEIKNEAERLKEITKTRSLTEEEKRSFKRLTK